MVINMIRQGRLVLVIGGQESQSYSKKVIRLESLRLDNSRDGQAVGWTSYLVAAQWLYSLKLKPRGTIRFESTQMDGSRDSQKEGWTSCLVVKDAQMRVGKQL
jgi:hypothetical protein